MNTTDDLPVLLRDVLEDAIAALPTALSPGTARSYISLLRRMLRGGYPVDRPAGALDPADLGKWMDYHGYRAKTRELLVAALRWAHRHAGIDDPALAPRGPASKLVRMQVSPERVQSFFLEGHQLEAIRSLSPEYYSPLHYPAVRNRAIVMFVLDTLATVSEVLHARREDLHADGLHVTLHMRPMPDNIVRIRHDTAAAIRDMLAAAPKSPWLFASTRGGRLRQSAAWKNISRVISPLVPMQRYVQPGRAIELLRASAARARVVEKGEDEESVMRACGIQSREKFRQLIGLVPRPVYRVVE